MNLSIRLSELTLGDSWEREGDDPSYFYTFAANGDAFGINVVLYSLTH
jgi:hypothetical protein